MTVVVKLWKMGFPPLHHFPNRQTRNKKHQEFFFPSPAPPNIWIGNSVHQHKIPKHQMWYLGTFMWTKSKEDYRCSLSIEVENSVSLKERKKTARQRGNFWNFPESYLTLVEDNGGKVKSEESQVSIGWRVCHNFHLSLSKSAVGQEYHGKCKMMMDDAFGRWWWWWWWWWW